MPHRVWTHRCSRDDSGRTLSEPVCDRCGGPGTFVGWSYGMYEDMARYQTFYRLKPIGLHRPMADELFRNLSVPCEACDGRGLLDHPRGCAGCPSCRGLARQLTVPAEVVESIRARILEEYPDAGAEPVEHFPYGVVIHDLARGVIIGAPREGPARGTSAGNEGDGDGADAMHPGYFTTHFRDYDEIEEWPDEFVILSAYATTGETWTEEQNERADDELRATLRGLGVWTHPVLGFSTESDHAEPSSAAALPLDEGRALGRRFRQDAIFHVRGDHLSVTRCEDGAPLVPVGGFRERLHLGFEPIRRLSTDEGSPWRLLTPERLSAAIERRLAPDPEAGELSDRVRAPREEVLLAEVLVEAMPDEASRRSAEEDLAQDHVMPEDVAILLDGSEDVGWVVQCEVTDSMVSGIWGLTELTVGDRGYLFDMPDFGATDQMSPRIVGGWIGRDDQEARQACIVSTYVRVWDQIGLPPLLGQWVEGNPSVLLSALLTVLATPEGERYWPEIMDRIREAGLYEVGPELWKAVADTFGVPPALVARMLDRPGAHRPDFEARVARGDLRGDEVKALAAIFLSSIMERFRNPIETQLSKPRLLGPVNEMVGRWRIRYADEDGLIGDDGGELVLRPDGTFSWTPEPDWIAGSGTWGVEIEPNGAPTLHLDTDDDRHVHFLVLERLPDLGTFFHWQRTRADAVIFKDRILRGFLVEGDGA